MHRAYPLFAALFLWAESAYTHPQSANHAPLDMSISWSASGYHMNEKAKYLAVRAEFDHCSVYFATYDRKKKTFVYGKKAILGEYNQFEFTDEVGGRWTIMLVTNDEELKIAKKHVESTHMAQHEGCFLAWWQTD